MYNNESNLPYLVNLINEKNRIIEELKHALIALNSKYIEMESYNKREIENLSIEIKNKEEKIKVLSEGDKFELIDFYENEISQIIGKYEIFSETIRTSYESIFSSSAIINDRKSNVKIILM